eukprot:CAMPEP_0181129406 /NCGR_PEP_ID=MMETSP1071-20121207/29305_1 /TAXON_ID=35127 /ORGANISM="Thalassiosira sp., Strain NH16" /LENGTH=141 /DNA_ID=CAMNT_0023215391 /DNA_START=286 /DNA_END=711 /DNA_ORIENTATION=+
MAVGQMFGEELYTVMSNAGVLIFIITILLVMAEVDKDIVATHDVACFLVQVAQKGDQIRVSRSAVLPPIQQPHDPPFPGEEKQPEDDENGLSVEEERRGHNESIQSMDSNAAFIEFESKFFNEQDKKNDTPDATAQELSRV